MIRPPRRPLAGTRPGTRFGAGVGLPDNPGAGWGCPTGIATSVLLATLAVGTALGGDVILNEIMYHPDTDRAGDEYLELHNRGTAAVNLTGWRLSAGVEFTFPPVVLAPGGFLVVAADGATFSARHPGVTGFVSGWQGRLSDNGETLTLRDGLGAVQDSVNYATEGDWGVREHGPDDHGHRGWTWTAAHAGGGPSLERINPRMPGDSGLNWAPSAGDGGTPGAANSVLSSRTAPVIAGVRHAPLVPRSTEPVTVLAHVSDDEPGAPLVQVLHRRDGDATFQTTPMFDDGQHGDGQSGDGEYGASLPAQAADTVVEFYVAAQDAGGQRRTWPAPVLPERAQLANCLYQVDDRSYGDPQPLYRVILTAAELAELEAIDALPWSWSSNAELNGTFISTEAGEDTLRYRIGFRLRGTTTRAEPVKSRRVSFPTDRRWRELRALNLNALNPHSQIIGSALARKAGLPAARARAVQLRENNRQRAPVAAPSFGVYAEVEVLNGDFAARQFPLDDEGNVYQAIGGGNLDYLGDTSAPYRDPSCYEKRTNTAEDDWSDLIELTSVLNRTPPETWFEELGRVAHVPGWITFFAVNTVIANAETALGTGGPGDYALYRGQADRRFHLLIHDLDSVLGVAGGLDRPLLRATNNPAIHRFLTAPEVTPRYFAELERLMAGPLTPVSVDALVDQLLADFVPAGVRQQLKAAHRTRVDFIRSQLPTGLRTLPALPLVEGIQVSTNARIALTGTADPATTHALRVSGVPADWDATTGAWTVPAFELQPGLNRLVVEALDAAGTVLTSALTRVWWRSGTGTPVTPLPPGETRWAASQGPYLVTGELTVPGDATLVVEPGTTVWFDRNARLRVLGRLLAEGTPERRIHFGREPGAGYVWGGLRFENALASRLRHLDLAHHNDPALYLTNSALVAEHVTFIGSFGNVLWGQNSSMVVRHCDFPDLPYGEHVRGDHLPPAGEWIFEGNTFGTTTGYSDILDLSGGRRPGPVLQVRNNVFRGGSDDALDLDGTDAHIEGNVFLHFRKANDSTSESGAISTGVYDGQSSDLVVVRNVFFDNEHDLILKEGSRVLAAHNSFVGTTRAVLLINEPQRPWESPPASAIIEDSLLWNPPLAVGNLDPALLANGTLELAIRRSLLLHAGPWTATRNLMADPRLVNLTNDFHLRPGSPAIGAAEGGRDLGAYAPAGAVISGEPPPVTWRTEASFHVTGPGLTHFRWRLDAGPWSAPLAIGSPVVLPPLAAGEHQVFALGLDSAGVWQLESAPTASRRWRVAPETAGVRLNEVLVWNRTAWADAGQFPGFIELWNDSPATADLGGTSLTDDPLAPRKFLFAPGTVVPPNGYLVVRLTPGTPASGLNAGFAPDRSGGVIEWHDRPGGNGRLASVRFGPQIPDAAVGALDDGTWSLTVPTPGTVNQPRRLGDPARLRLSEWLAKPGPAWDSDFIELFNPDDLPVSLAGLALAREPVGNPREYPLPPLSFIGARDHVVFFAGDSRSPTASRLPFRLAAEGGTLALVGADGTWLDWIEYDSQRTGVSQGREEAAVTDLPVPTPGTSMTVVPGSGAVVLSEILANNRSLTNAWGAASDWIEVRNVSTNRASLAGLSLTDRIEEPDRWSFPAATTLPPGEFLLVSCEPALPASTNNTGFGLSAAGETIYLFDRTDGVPRLVDSVTFGFQAADLSLARFDAQADDWRLAHPTAGTENEEAFRSGPGALRVNEWMADAGTDPDWLELVNPTDLPVVLDGTSLSDTSTNPAKYVFPARSFLASGPAGHLLLYADEKPGNGADHLPFKLSAQGEAILLTAPGGTRIDAIFFGPQQSNVPQGRLPDGADLIRSLPPGGSPGAANSLNTRPLLAAVPDQVALTGEPWDRLLAAYDPDPGQSLVFRLKPPFPAGLTVTPADGRLQWAPGWELAGTQFTVTIEATDNGAPPQTATVNFDLRVEASTAVPVWNPPWTDAAGDLHLSWAAQPGIRYAVDFTPEAGSGVWLNLLEVTASAAQIELAVSPEIAIQRFFRIRRLP